MSSLRSDSTRQFAIVLRILHHVFSSHRDVFQKTGVKFSVYASEFFKCRGFSIGHLLILYFRRNPFLLTRDPNQTNLGRKDIPADNLMFLLSPFVCLFAVLSDKFCNRAS